MDRSRPDSAWADSYVRDKLSEEQVADFEVAMLESPAIQDQVEEALHIRQLLDCHPDKRKSRSRNFFQARSGFINWLPAALAASLLAALVSTALFVQSRQQLGHLQDQLTAALAPTTRVMTVPIDIMRSVGNGPQVVVQKPAGASAIMLEIELPPQFRELEIIQFQLRPESSTSILAWNSTPGPDGRTQVVLPSQSVPEGLVYLDIQAPGIMQPESRLLKFRPAMD